MQNTNDKCKIATWNVNSLRTRLSHLLQFMADYSPDIILLQELKLEEDKLPRMEIEDAGYNIVMLGQKTYNGVAILSKTPLEDVKCGLYEDAQARYIEAVTYFNGNAIRVASVYVPNGQEVDSDKFYYKLEFMQHLQKHMEELLSLKEILIVGGDYNIAPEVNDVYDSEKLAGSVCFEIRERRAIREILNLGYYDAFRVLNPDIHAYSWWDYRGGDFERDHGLRIDHLLTSPEAIDILHNCEIVKTMRSLEKPSDHAPVMAWFNM